MVNEYDMHRMHRVIKITQGQFAKVSWEDYDWLMQWKWFATWNKSIGSFYACRTEYSTGNRRIWMHRALLGLEYGDKRQGDHKNHDTLDNRRDNLRIASPLQNSYNKRLSKRSTSGYKGASLHKATGRWRSYIVVNGKLKSLGYFTTPEEAHAAYCSAAQESYGEFARKS